MVFRFDFPDVDDVSAVADWIEVMMLLSRKPQISRSQLMEAIAAKTGSTLQELETSTNLLFSEMGRRRRIVGVGYPLIIEEHLIKLDEGSNPEFYKFLLLVSLDGPMRRGRRYKEIDEIFDKVVCAAWKAYLGEGANALRFGWPASDDRPKQFKQALEWLSTKTGVPVGSGTFAPKTKDGGVDVVAWKPFADHRTAFLIILSQCTVQADWYPKSRDVIDRIWFSRIDTGGCALTSLAIPFIIPRNFDRWDDLRRTVSVVFDRLRLAQVLNGSDLSSFGSMMKWNSREISKFAMSM